MALVPVSAVETVTFSLLGIQWTVTLFSSRHYVLLLYIIILHSEKKNGLKVKTDHGQSVCLVDLIYKTFLLPDYHLAPSDLL